MQTQEFLKLDFNERSDKLSEVAKSYPFGETLWRYPERQQLEQQIADINQLQKEQVFCSNGGDEAIMLLMRIIKQEDLSMILPLPAFSQYTWGVSSWDIKCDTVSQNENLSINIQAIIDAINTTANAVTIITRPNNPTGEVIALDSLESIIRAAKTNNGWVFLDEAYIEFSGESNLANSKRLLEKFDNLISLRTFSKAYGLAGIRLGYLLGNTKLIEKFRQRCIPFNIPQPSLDIAKLALAPENQKEVKHYCKVIAQNRETFFKWFSQNNIQVLPSQANFFILQLPAKQAKAIQSFLSKNKILVRNFEGTDAATAGLTNCLRITIPFNLDKLLALLEQCLKPGLICMDMDGVLIDTTKSYDETIKATVELLTGKVIEQDLIDQLKNKGGYNNDWIVTQKILKDLGYALSLDEVTDKFQALYLGTNNDGFVANEKPLINNELVNTIKQTQTTTFAIVTGRPRKEANAGKALINLSELDLISLDDVEQPKPSPEGVEKLKNKYSTLSWMCGDNPDDMQCAVASNSLAIGIGKKNAATLYQAGADIVLNNINELEAWLCPIK